MWVYIKLVDDTVRCFGFYVLFFVSFEDNDNSDRAKIMPVLLEFSLHH
jgi:hypothetical protein